MVMSSLSRALSNRPRSPAPAVLPAAAHAHAHATGACLHPLHVPCAHGAHLAPLAAPAHPHDALLAAHSPPGAPAFAVPPAAAAGAAGAVGSDLQEYISAGPLLASCGITPSDVARDLPTWERLGRKLASQLGFDHDAMDATQRLRVYRYYLPVYFWVDAQLQAHRARHGANGNGIGGGAAPPLVLGISAPQGCGKSTLVEQLEALFASEGARAAAVSIDDFYLTRAEQAALADANASNRLLQLRGNAGSHDLALGADTLRALRALGGAGQAAAVPRYDKSAFGGLGDRAPRAHWPVVEGPLDVVLFEGWMLGFAPIDGAAAAAIDPSLAEVNARLADYEAAWDAHVDSWLVIRIGDPQWVYGWRLQAEQRMRAAGRPGMTDEAVADFVSRYIPAYSAYLPGLYARGPTTAAAGRALVIEVDEKRAPVAAQPAAPALAAAQ